MLELVFSWYLASSCWCLALSCARSQSVEGELYPKLMTVIWSYCAGCRLWPLLLRLPQLRRTIQYHYFHFDRSPLQEPVRAEGGSAEDAGEVTSSLLCSRSSGIFIEVCERSACSFSSQDGLVVFWLLPFPWYSVGSIWSSSVCIWAVVFAECFICLAIGLSLSFFLFSRFGSCIVHLHCACLHFALSHLH